MLEKTDWVGKQLGHYRLLRPIGKGGFADVYLGEHVHLMTRAAVKLLHTRLSDEDVENFRREAQMIARLVHPNIVRVFDFGVENNIPYLVMDYASHGTLRQRHSKGVPLASSVVASYVLQIAEALQYGHDQHLVHRDVKPENMLVGGRQEILLSDFGIALMSQTSNFQHTQNIAGTAAYMAPEQIQAHPRPASDQYSLGIVTYEWLTGQRPFQGSFSELAVKHVLTPPPPLRTLVPNVSPPVEEVVMIALRKDPQQRFPNVRAFAQALQQASQKGSSFQSAPSTFVYPQSAPQLPVSPAPFVSQRSPGSVGVSPSAPVSAIATRVPQDQRLNVSSPSAPLMPPGAFVQTPPYPMGTPYPQMAASGSPAPSRRVSRRALLAGALGLVAVSSGATWYVANQLTHASSSLASSIVTSGNPLAKLAHSEASISPQLTYSAQQDYVWAVDWSPDGKYVVSGSHDGTTHVWNATTAQRLLSYRSATRPAVSDNWAMAVSWSPDSKKIAIGFIDGTVQVVDIGSGELLHTYGQHPAAPVDAVTWSPKGDYLALAGSDVKVYEFASERLVTTFDKHTDTVLTTAWSPNGMWLASGSVDGKVKVWKPFTGEEQLNYTSHSEEVRSVAWSHDSTRIVSSSWDRTVKVWEATTGHTLYTYGEQPVAQMMDSAAWSHNDKYIAMGGHDIYLRICDANTGKLLQSFSAYPVYSLAWSPDDKRVVTGGISDKKVQIWKLE